MYPPPPANPQALRKPSLEHVKVRLSSGSCAEFTGCPPFPVHVIFPRANLKEKESHEGLAWRWAWCRGRQGKRGKTVVLEGQRLQSSRILSPDPPPPGPPSWAPPQTLLAFSLSTGCCLPEFTAVPWLFATTQCPGHCLWIVNIGPCSHGSKHLPI